MLAEEIVGLLHVEHRKCGSFELLGRDLSSGSPGDGQAEKEDPQTTAAVENLLHGKSSAKGLSRNVVQAAGWSVEFEDDLGWQPPTHETLRDVISAMSNLLGYFGMVASRRSRAAGTVGQETRRCEQRLSARAQP
jgi:hypothetical protein